MRSIILNAYSIESILKKIEIAISRGFKTTVAFIYSSSDHNIKKLVVGLESHPFVAYGGYNWWRGVSQIRRWVFK